MKKLAISSLTATLLAAISIPAMAQSVDLSISGTVTPGTCAISMAGGSVIDFGDMDLASLGEGNDKVLPRQTKPLSINCPAGARVALTFQDQKSGTAAGGAQKGFGLGTHDGNNIGFYTMSFTNIVGDSNPLNPVISSDTGVTWIDLGTQAIFNNDTVLNSWADIANSTNPVQVTSLSADLNVSTTLRGIDAYHNGDDVVLDGATTITMEYL